MRKPNKFQLVGVLCLLAIGWTVGEIIRLPFPDTPWWMSFPLGLAFATQLVISLGMRK